MDWDIEGENLLRNHREFLKEFARSTLDESFDKDPLVTAYNLGVESVGKRICQNLAMHHPDKFAELLGEVYNERYKQ